MDLHSNMPTTQVYQDFLASLSFLSLPHTSVSALPFPSLSQSTPAKVTFSSSDPLQLLLQLPLFPITASVNNPHLNEGTCIESPLWSGAAELCRSSQRCCSQWASRKTPSLPTGATVPHLPCSSKPAADLCQKETMVLLPDGDRAQEHRQTSLNPPFSPQHNVQRLRESVEEECRVGAGLL